MTIHHIGLMTVRNEMDILQEGLDHHARWFEKLVVIDGSTDGGREELARHPAVCTLIRDEDILRPGERFCDAHRQVGLDWIREHIGVDDVWVTLCHPDERWEDDPVLMAEWAARDGATWVLWGEYRRFIGQMGPIGPMTERFHGPFFEARQFDLAAHQIYVPGRDHATLPCAEHPRRWRHIPRYRHYPNRSPRQVARRAKEKGRRMIQPDHEPFEEQFCRDAPPKPANSPLAAWENIIPAGHPLPDPEPFLPEWWKRENPGV